MQDPYATLGVDRSASQDEIRKAYRALAKTYHPDLNPGDAAAADRFKDIASAYDILGDEDKRRKFDAGEIDATGAETQRRYWKDYAESADAGQYRSSRGFEDFVDLSDLFGDVFSRGEAGGAGRGPRPRRGRDASYHLDVDFLDAVNGGKTRVTMPDGKTLDIAIPPGLREGQVLRLSGQGEPGRAGGPPGDALVEVSILSHPYFRREGDDIHVALPVTIDEAALGAEVEVPTVSGRVRVKVPAGATTGRVLRLRGKGAPKAGGGAGDQLVRLEVAMPPTVDEELAAFLKDWRTRHGYDPRRG